ncbi:MAG: hypothetical protein AAFU80_03915 [Pseudomonadota bacterium]
MTLRTIAPLVVLALVQGLDVFVHVVTGQIEPIRIASNLILIVGAGAAVLVPTRSGVLLLLAGTIYLVLNGAFVAQHGLINPTTGALRAPLFGFVVASLLLATWLRRRLLGQGDA